MKEPSKENYQLDHAVELFIPLKGSMNARIFWSFSKNKSRLEMI